MSRRDDKLTTLTEYEWTLFTIVASIALTLAIIITVSKPAPKQKRLPGIEVTVIGEVQKEGTYVLPKGAVLSDLLEKGGITPLSYVKKLKMKRKLKNGEFVKIKSVPTITIRIEGAVKQAITLTVPKGTRRQTLLRQIAPLKDADLSPLYRKLTLKNGEVFVINYLNSKEPAINKRKAL